MPSYLSAVDFRLPRGGSFQDADGMTVTIAAADTWTDDTLVAWVEVEKLLDFTASAGKLEPDTTKPAWNDPHYLRVKGKINMEPAAGTVTINVRLVDAANSDKVLATSTAASVAALTPADFVFDEVVEIPVNADLTLQFFNDDDTANITVNSAILSVSQP